jgi:cold shock CspA family protein
MTDRRQRYRGRVVWFDDWKGYGLIETPDGERVFLHRHALGGMRVEPGDILEFEVYRAGQGPAAERIEKIACESTNLSSC